MPICQQCQQKWTWLQTIKKTFTLDQKITCPQCGDIQYFTHQSKLKSASLNALVLLPLLINLFFDLPGILILSLFPITFIIIMSLHPFIVKLSNKREESFFL